MVIRLAQEKDLLQLIQLYNSLYALLNGQYRYPFLLNEEQNAKALAVRIQSKLFHILVAEEDGIIWGFILGSISRLDPRISYVRDGAKRAIGRIDDVYVSPEKRGGGLAIKLTEALEEWFRREGVAIVEGYIVDRNTPSLEFYERRGYETAAHRVVKWID